MTALVHRAPVVPVVADGRCALSAETVPPCVECEGSGKYRNERCGCGPLVSHVADCGRPARPCPTCGGSGVAPAGTPIVVVADGQVVLWGRLESCRDVDYGQGTVHHWPDYRVTLSDVVALDPPISEWRSPVPGLERRYAAGPRPEFIDWPVASLPDSEWSVCPPALLEAVEARR